jgi:DNA invertase Pin-like site-specific DNA recombinase
LKAYGYLRVSGKGQVDGDGFIRQEQAINDYAAAHGIEVASIFREEGVSGTEENRVALAAMMFCAELGVTRQALCRYVGPDGALR